jgi:glycosyltransferase involved in cell wall biosynthesis
LVADDGSRDGSDERLSAWAERDPRIRLRGAPSPDGGAAPRPPRMIPLVNEALREARGDLVARMDADDIAHPERLAEQVAFLDANPHVSIVDSRVSWLGDDSLMAARETPRDLGHGDTADASTRRERSSALGMRLYIDWLNGLANAERGRGESHDAIARDIFVESPIVNPAVVVRRSALLSAGGYRDGAFPEDYDLWLRLFLAGHRFAKLPRALLEWRDHAARLTRTHPRYGLDAFAALKRDALWALEGAQIAEGATVVWGAGSRGRSWRRFLRERGVTPAFLVDVDARKIGRALSGVPVRAPDALDAHPWDYLLVVVAARGARDEIRAYLARAGFVDAAGREIKGKRIRFVQ